MEVRCPECLSEATYKYGTISGGKQRYICLLCERQFVANPEKKQYKNKPRCPECGKPMHSYMKGPDHIRFRCSDYPRCKTYLKTRKVEFEIVGAEMISKECNLEQFVGTVQGKPTWEALYLANEEATAAGRLLLKAKSMEDKHRNQVSEYIDSLTGFIFFLKASVKIPREGKDSNPLYWKYWDSIAK